MSTIALNHFALTKDQYKEGLEAGRYSLEWDPDLSIAIDPDKSFNKFKWCLDQVDPDLQWNRQHKARDGAYVQNKLDHPQTTLFELLADIEQVGFALAKEPDDTIKARFFGAANDIDPEQVIEFDYLAMFDGEAGKGRGKQYFEMLFDLYFKTHDAIFWSQHTTNAPTLERFYREDIGMTHLAQDEIPDFRQ